MSKWLALVVSSLLWAAGASASEDIYGPKSPELEGIYAQCPRNNPELCAEAAARFGKLFPHDQAGPYLMLRKDGGGYLAPNDNVTKDFKWVRSGEAEISLDFDDRKRTRRRFSWDGLYLKEIRGRALYIQSLSDSQWRQSSAEEKEKKKKREKKRAAAKRKAPKAPPAPEVSDAKEAGAAAGTVENTPASEARLPETKGELKETGGQAEAKVSASDPEPQLEAVKKEEDKKAETSGPESSSTQDEPQASEAKAESEQRIQEPAKEAEKDRSAEDKSAGAEGSQRVEEPVKEAEKEKPAADKSAADEAEDGSGQIEKKKGSGK